MNRALLWLVGGFVVLVLAVLAIAPELIGGAAFSALGLTLVAAVPAVVVAALFVSSRRRRGLPPRGTAAPTPSPAPPDDDAGPDRPDRGA